MSTSNPPVSIPEDRISAVHSLEGHTLKTGWTVIQKIKSKPGSTGGNFSVCYTAEKNGQTGFLKVLNFLSFLRDDNGDTLQAMTNMLNAFNYERDLLTRCNNKNLNKVSKLLEANTEHISGFFIPNVYYMIFEKADDDARNHLSFSGKIDIAWKLRSLHHVSTGLKQLHSVGIQHQDVKPSNIFVFDSNVSKIGDLGRSLCNDIKSPHDGLVFTGDRRYAPPECMHRFSLPNEMQKLLAIDMFLLGSLATFYFTGQNMTSLLIQNLDNRISIYSINFDEALAYWNNAFDISLSTIADHLDGYNDTMDIVDQISMLCQPDPRKRGHPTNINQIGSNFILERFVSKFNYLASRAEYNITH
jgi:serine/threonine protein kinase